MVRSLRMMFALCVVLLTACGSTVAETSTEAEPAATGAEVSPVTTDPPLVIEESLLTCSDNFETILELSRAGISEFTFEPAETLDDLLFRTEAVLSGDLTLITSVGQGGALMGLENVEVLSGTSSLSESAEFLTNPLFPRDEEPELLEPVAVEGVNVVAFIDEFDWAPYGVVVDIEGLAFGCSEGPATSVISSFPAPLENLTTAELTALVTEQ